MEEHDIPTLPFRLLTGDDIDGAALAKEFGLPLVQKARRGGYDGRGVQILRDEAALAALWPTPSLVEPFLGGSREISVLLARDAEGNTRTWPTLGMDFDPVLNSLTTVHTPAGLPQALEDEALALGTRVVETLEGVGVFAIEMFISQEDILYVNEISPRVHNSGHLTMEASATSQFEQHLRAVAGLPLGDVATARPAAMANILYEERFEPVCPDRPLCQLSDGEELAIHWYGKPPGQLGRKMGHITALADTAEEACKMATEALADLPNRAARAA